jgi:hypothetical protein
MEEVVVTRRSGVRTCSGVRSVRAARPGYCVVRAKVLLGLSNSEGQGDDDIHFTRWMMGEKSWSLGRAVGDPLARGPEKGARGEDRLVSSDPLIFGVALRPGVADADGTATAMQVVMGGWEEDVTGWGVRKKGRDAHGIMGWVLVCWEPSQPL